MVVLGMGKLGGFELNAGSDVDLIFLNDTDAGGSEISLHDHFTRVGRRLTRTLEDVTEDGFVWRVDLRLRPEGSQGPIVNSVSAAERYYEAWGRTWERAALLRGRPMAGDLALGQRFHAEVVEPFVFRRVVDPSIATTLSRLVEQSRLELSGDADNDLKHGVGGLREAEFFVQALQLIWGGKEPTLRVQSMREGCSGFIRAVLPAIVRCTKSPEPIGCCVAPSTPCSGRRGCRLIRCRPATTFTV